MVEFLREGLAEAPLALGALVGFALGTPVLIVAEIRERKRRKAWRAELDRWRAAFEADHAAWVARHSAPKEGS
jgi:hypothetical protein